MACGGGTDCLANIAAPQFEHALMNLAANAREVMPFGGKLTLDTACVDLDEAAAAAIPEARPGQFVRVSVRDTGQGMDSATMARMFEPFFTTKPRGQGTGLGLSMVYGFVKQSGGFVAVSSEPGRGTCVSLHFPRVTERILTHATAVPTAATIPATATIPANVRGCATVLVVEDEEGIRGLLSRCLAEAGYRVFATGDANEAISLAGDKEAGADILITDVVMPETSGVELARRIRERRPDLPILFVSGYGGEDLSRRGIDLARAEVLLKPFQHAQLLETVRRMLEAR